MEWTHSLKEAVAEHWRKAIVRQSLAISRFVESSHVCVRLSDMMSDEDILVFHNRFDYLVQTRVTLLFFNLYFWVMDMYVCVCMYFMYLFIYLVS